MKLVEVLPLTVIRRPFDAKMVREKAASAPFRYYNIIQPFKTVAEMNWITRHLLEQNEFLVMTIVGSTYLEKGARLDQLQPLAFFNSAFDCGRDSQEVDVLLDCLVNMTKQEVSPELRALLHGQFPYWRMEYSGVKIILSRKTAILPGYLMGKELPIIHLPDVRMAAAVE